MKTVRASAKVKPPPEQPPPPATPAIDALVAAAANDPLMAATATLKTNTGIAGKLNRIHHDLNHISGGLVQRIVRRNLSKKETLEWAATLHRLADDLEAVVS